MSKISNNKRVFSEVENKLLNIDLKKMGYLSSFRVVADFLPVAISNDYIEALPDKFLSKLFADITRKSVIDFSHLPNSDRETLAKDYSKRIDNLNKSLYAINRFYTKYTISEDPKRIEEYAKYRIIDSRSMAELLNCVCCSPILVKLKGDQLAADIDFPKFPTVDEFVKYERFADHALQDVEYILSELGGCAKICTILRDSENSFLKFGNDLYNYMHGNIKSVFKRDIINYTAFKYAVNGYPYRTISRRLYSVRNVEGVQNKFVLHDLYTNNVKSILTGLSDMTFGRTTIKGQVLDQDMYESKVLMNAYATCILLIALHGEIVLKDKLEGKPILNSAFKNRGSIGFATTYEKDDSIYDLRVPADKPWNIDEENRPRSLESSNVYVKTEVPGLHDIAQLREMAKSGRVDIEIDNIDFNKEM